MFAEMRARNLLALVAISLVLSGCIVRTAANVVTAPVRIGAKAVDLATTSQSEADEARGREIRKREERLGELERQYRKQRGNCEAGDRAACRDAETIYDEMQALLPTVPVEPDRD
jgi:hypothetical protein